MYLISKKATLNSFLVMALINLFLVKTKGCGINMEDGDDGDISDEIQFPCMAEWLSLCSLLSWYVVTF